MIDSHAHIHFKDFQGELDAVIARAREAGVERIVNIGTDPASSREVVGIAEKHPEIFAAVGVHPHDAAKMREGDQDLRELAELARHPKVVGLGEVGLDYYYEHSPREVQQARLRDLVRLAREVKKPLIIHCRDAMEDCLRILDAEDGWKGGGVFHCYTGDFATAERIVNKGFYISISGIITFKKSHELQEVARLLPLDRILIETDAPFLAPVPYRGKRNEPAYVVYVAKKLAELRGIEIREIEEAISRNVRELFGIGT